MVKIRPIWPPCVRREIKEIDLKNVLLRKSSTKERTHPPPKNPETIATYCKFTIFNLCSTIWANTCFCFNYFNWSRCGSGLGSCLTFSFISLWLSPSATLAQLMYWIFQTWKIRVQIEKPEPDKSQKSGATRLYLKQNGPLPRFLPHQSSSSSLLFLYLHHYFFAYI
jgi:hypothetical protein